MSHTDTLLLQEVTAKAQQWLSPEYDEATRNEVVAMLENEDKTPLIEAFYKDLEFGTGGLRGIMGAGTNRMNRYTVAMATQGLANYINKACAHLPERAVVIGHDCRHNSDYFTEITAAVFSANGIKAYVFDTLRPTPEISFAIRHLGCQAGVMITASHNPKIYNGYKAYWGDGAQVIAPHDVNIIAEVSQIASMAEVKQEAQKHLIVTIGEAIDTVFIEAVKGLSLAPESVARHHDMGIVYTPIHGTGRYMVPRAIESFGFTNVIHVPEQDVISGDFPTVESPNPEEPAALTMAMKRADETGANLVLASDPDGDRIGVAVRGREGKMHLINGNQICMLLTYYSIIHRKELGQLQPNDFVVKTIVTTDLIKAIAEKEAVTLFECYTGFKWIAKVIREQEDKLRYIGGGEESYGYLWEDFIRDKSSVSACAIFAELTAWALDKGMSIDDLLTHIYVTYGYFVDKGHYIIRTGKSGQEEILEMMKSYRATPLKTLAGSPVVKVLDYKTLKARDLTTGKEYDLDMPAESNVLQYIAEDGSKLSIRPSGTEPKIKYYIGICEKLTQAESLSQTQTLAEQRIAQVFEQLGI